MLLTAFAAVLLLAVLISSLAHRTILSTAVLFLAAGFLLGDETLGLLSLQPGSPIVATLAELALFAVLFTDGMRIGWADLRSAWRLPGRALGWGLPLTLLGTALLARYVAGLDWPEALLIGAVLAPTDPVFAAALVGNRRVPARLRHLLNVESGVNDGFALPFVVLLLALASESRQLHLGSLAGELALGVAIGVTVPVAAILAERSRFFAASTKYEPLNAVAIGLRAERVRLGGLRTAGTEVRNPGRGHRVPPGGAHDRHLDPRALLHRHPGRQAVRPAAESAHMARGRAPKSADMSGRPRRGLNERTGYPLRLLPSAARCRG